MNSFVVPVADRCCCARLGTSKNTMRIRAAHTSFLLYIYYLFWNSFSSFFFVIEFLRLLFGTRKWHVPYQLRIYGRVSSILFMIYQISHLLDYIVNKNSHTLARFKYVSSILLLSYTLCRSIESKHFFFRAISFQFHGLVAFFNGCFFVRFFFFVRVKKHSWCLLYTYLVSMAAVRNRKKNKQNDSTWWNFDKIYKNKHFTSKFE